MPEADQRALEYVDLRRSHPGKLDALYEMGGAGRAGPTRVGVRGGGGGSAVSGGIGCVCGVRGGEGSYCVLGTVSCTVGSCGVAVAPWTYPGVADDYSK